MIRIVQKQFQLVLRGSSKSDPDQTRQFDHFEDAQAELAAERERGQFASGVLMEWRPQAGTWTMLDRFGGDEQSH